MSRSYGIWVEVDSDANYKKNPSFGGTHDTSMMVNVGTSGSNSNPLGCVRILRRWFVYADGSKGWHCSIKVGSQTVVEKYYDKDWNEIHGEKAVEEIVKIDYPRKRKVVTRRANKYTA